MGPHSGEIGATGIQDLGDQCQRLAYKAFGSTQLPFNPRISGTVDNAVSTLAGEGDTGAKLAGKVSQMFAQAIPVTGMVSGDRLQALHQGLRELSLDYREVPSFHTFFKPSLNELSNGITDWFFKLSSRARGPLQGGKPDVSQPRCPCRGRERRTHDRRDVHPGATECGVDQER